MIRINAQLGVQFDDEDTRDETTRQVLWAMRRSLTEIGWCQSMWAQADAATVYTGAEGVIEVEPDSRAACRFCLGGALAFVLNDKTATTPDCMVNRSAGYPSPLALAIRKALGSRIYARSRYDVRYSETRYPDAIDIMVDWNDDAYRTIEDVLATIEDTIAHIPGPDLVRIAPTPGA